MRPAAAQLESLAEARARIDETDGAPTTLLAGRTVDVDRVMVLKAAAAGARPTWPKRDGG